MRHIQNHILNVEWQHEEASGAEANSEGYL